jgi:hypothetical protein
MARDVIRAPRNPILLIGLVRNQNWGAHIIHCLVSKGNVNERPPAAGLEIGFEGSREIRGGERQTISTVQYSNKDEVNRIPIL